MSKPHDFDLFIIGAGSAGVRCARIAAGLGAKVAVAEKQYLGGTCVNVGCVPKKLMVYAARCASELADARGYGWQTEQASFDWSVFLEKKDNEINRLNGIYRNLLVNAGATLFDGLATIPEPGSVTVNGQTYSCKHTVIATGSWPRSQERPGAELAITSNEVFHLPQLPKSVVIEGGGYIAVEFAGILHGLGCEVDLVYRGALFMKGFAKELREALAESYSNKGIRLHFDTEITALSRRADGRIQVTDNRGEQRTTDTVLSAIGREPNLEGLDLASLGIETSSKGHIVVDDQYQTSRAGIYALGDVVGRLPLTPVALQEGEALARYLFKGTPIEVDYRGVPTAVFSLPEIATVGLTREDAERAGHVTEIFAARFKPMKNTISGREEQTWLQMVVDRPTDRVLGCHMIGDYAAEMMQGIAVAVNMGATKQAFDKTFAIHPTSAEEWVTLK